MKKLFLFIITCTTIFSAIQADAQSCTPSADFNYNGIYPEVLPKAMEGVYYHVVLSFKIPRDSQAVINGATINVTIDSARCVFIKGIPDGYTYQCNTASCTWPGGSKGCAVIQGTVDTADHKVGEYPITVYTQTWYTAAGFSAQRIDSSSNLKIKIITYNGLFEISSYTKLNAYPNPTNGKINIELRDIHEDENEISIMDAFGKIVYSQQFNRPDRFLTTYSADLSGYKPGLYFISLRSGDRIGYSKVMLH